VAGIVDMSEAEGKKDASPCVPIVIAFDDVLSAIIKAAVAFP